MITQKRLANFYHQFATMINAGVNITQALRSLGESTGHIRLRKIIYGVRVETEKGNSLCASMGFYPHIFSALQLRIIEIGEKTGNLGKSLARIGDNLDRNYRTQTKLITGFIYPVFLLHAAIFIPAVPILFLQGSSLFWERVASMIIPLYGIFLLILVIAKISNRNHELKKFFQYTFSCIPLIGSLIKKLAIARFMWNLSTLYRAGENMGRSVKLAVEGCGNIPLSNAVLKILPDIEQGKSLTSAFKRVRFFPSMVTEMLAAGEESGKIGDMLDKVAEYYEAEHGTVVKRIVIILPVLIYLMVAVYIAYIVISSYAGYFDQISNLFEGF